LFTHLDTVARSARERLGSSIGERLAVDGPRLDEARRLLSFFDGLSLMLLGTISPARTSEELTFGEDSAVLSLAWQETALALSPWPFEPVSVRVELSGSKLARSTFAKSDDLAQALRAATPWRWERELRKI